VQVNIASIESSLTLSNMPVDVTNLADNLQASSSPFMVDVIISGPIPILDKLTANDVHVYVNLEGVTTAGTGQHDVIVDLNIPELKVQSILPGSVEITVSPRFDRTQTIQGKQPVATSTSTPKPVK
jgi:YbbR domain-containing protein